jgi:hypothetical protein
VKNNVERLYQQRTSPCWAHRLAGLLRPPDPFVANPRELQIDAPLGRWNLYIGGAGSRIEAYVNVDLVALPGVDVVADAEALPFRTATFQRVECDAVIEHVERPRACHEPDRARPGPWWLRPRRRAVLSSVSRITAGFRRFTPDGLEQLAGPFQVVAEGWRSGPTATLLVFILEYVKLWLPWRPARAVAHGVLGWLLFPLRYLDLILLRAPRARQMGNHFYVWLRKSDRHCDG